MKHVLCLVLLTIGIACCALLARRAGSADTLAPTPYDAAIRRAARRHLPEGSDWRIFKAMVYQESRFDPHALSLSGAVGLCQLMPATADRLGLRRADLQRPEISLDAGARYLRECWDTLEGLEDAPPRWDRSRAAVAAYHAGPGAVRRARAACGPAGRSWHAISGQLPEAVRRHVDAVFGEAYRGTRRVHPGGAPGVCTPAVEFPGPGRGRGPQR